MKDHDIYYACLKFKDGHVEKKEFASKKEAREYISTQFNNTVHISCWTE